MVISVGKRTTVEIEKFTEELNAFRERAHALFVRARDSEPTKELLDETLSELLTSLEKLQKRHRQMLQHNEAMEVAAEALKKALQEQETQQQRYQELFNFAPEGYLVTDTEGR